MVTGEELDDMGGTRGTVMKQVQSFTNLQPKKAREIRPLPKEITFQKAESPTHKKRGLFICLLDVTAFGTLIR